MFLAEHKDSSISQLEALYKEKLNRLIDTLIETVPKEDEPHVLFAAHCAEDEICFYLVKLSDVGNEDAISYAYEFTPFEEAVTFLVADTYLTQYSINELLADFLFEVSWTGFNQEHLQETVDRIIESLEEAKSERDCMTFDEFKTQLEKDTGIEFEKPDPQQEKAWLEYLKHVVEYDSICKNIELRKIAEVQNVR